MNINMNINMNIHMNILANAAIKRHSSIGLGQSLRKKLSLKSLGVGVGNKERSTNNHNHNQNQSPDSHPRVNHARKRKSAKNAKNIKGKVIAYEHELYTLTMGMMLGLRVSVRMSVMHFYIYMSVVYWKYIFISI